MEIHKGNKVKVQSLCLVLSLLSAVVINRMV